MLLAALFGEILLPELRIIPALMVVGGAIIAVAAWWLFAKGVWALLKGDRKRGVR